MAGPSLWFDEAYEFWASNVPFSQLSHEVIKTYQPPLYNYVAHFWLMIGHSAFSFRLLSVLINVIAISILIRWYYELTRTKSAWIIGLIAVFFPSDIRYAQEAAEYALMYTFLVAFIYAFWVALTKQKQNFFIFAAIFATMSALSQYGSMLVIIAIASTSSIYAFYKKNRPLVRQLSLFWSLFFIPTVSILYFFLPYQIQRQDLGRTILVIQNFRAELANLFNALEKLSLFGMTGYSANLIYNYYAISLFFLIIAFTVILAFHKNTQFIFRIVSLWLLSCLAIYFISVRVGIYGYGNFGNRYGIIVYPIMHISWAITFYHLMRVKISNTIIKYFIKLLVLMLFSFIPFSIMILNSPSRLLIDLLTLEQVKSTQNASINQNVEPIKEIFFYWSKHRQDGQKTFIFYGAAPAFAYYYKINTLGQSDLARTWDTPCANYKYCDSENIVFGEGFRSYFDNVTLNICSVAK
ncbi:MAG TPA: glycosyltransferase family 39 protein [Anaerolineales bacterium]|nr:glycosyltransferase family 39 protein [Anaerolineales bacterium]